MTTLPAIRAVMAAHRLLTIVADAGMVSDANKRAIEAAGLSFIRGMKILEVPYVIDKWIQHHPDDEVPDRHIFTQPWPAASEIGKSQVEPNSSCSARSDGGRVGVAVASVCLHP